MTYIDNRRDEATALLEPLSRAGFIIRPCASSDAHLLVCYPQYGIRQVSIDGILSAPDPAAYCREHFVGEGVGK
jgi:hypothetical protein